MAIPTAQGHLWVCDYCALTHETGETPAGFEGLGHPEAWNLHPSLDVTNDGEAEVTEFSWRLCGACGSDQAGRRHRYTWWQ